MNRSRRPAPLRRLYPLELEILCIAYGNRRRGVFYVGAAAIKAMDWLVEAGLLRAVHSREGFDRRVLTPAGVARVEAALGGDR